MKSVIADDSVGFPHVKVGHCQDLIRKPCYREIWTGLFLCLGFVKLQKRRQRQAGQMLRGRWGASKRMESEKMKALYNLKTDYYGSVVPCNSGF